MPATLALSRNAPAVCAVVLSVLLGVAPFPGRAAVQATPVDLSAIERFWPVYEALREDRDPADTQWEALFSTPAWEVLGPFRIRQTRARYEMAFRPSKEGAYAAALAEGGYEAGVLRHLRRVVEREGDLRALQARLSTAPETLDASAAIRRAAMYLPEGATQAGPSPAVGLVLYAAEGYGDTMVIIDLLMSLDLGSRVVSLLAHEFHHVYQGRFIAPFTRPAGGSADQVLLETLFQLQREGVANLVDKRTIPVDPGAAMTPERARSFADDVTRSPQVLVEMDRRLDQLDRVGHPPEAPERLVLAREIRWRVLPAGGHPTGFFMARAILEQLGREALVATLRNPFDFVRAYNRAASLAGAPEFGPGAMAALDALERRLFRARGAPPADGGRCRHSP
jgi:hypothetical protein